MSNTLKLLIGLLLLCLLALLCTWFHHSSIESKLKAAVAGQLQGTEFANVSADFNGAVGTLTGTVSSEEAHQKALASARNAAGFLFPITDNLKVAGEELPVKTSTSSLKASYDPNGKLILTGVVPDEATRAALIKDAESLVGAGNVIDQMTINSALPAFPGNANSLLKNFVNQGANLKGGVLNISGGDVSIEGAVPSEETKKAIGDMMSKMNGFNVTNLLTVQAPSNPELQKELNETLSIENIEFETGSAKIKASSMDIIDKAAKYLTKFATNAVEIQGHTDNTGNPAKNQPLSEKRAQAVKEAMVAKGVPNPNRLTAKGFGSSSPIADNNTAAGRLKNRRVMFVVQ